MKRFAALFFCILLTMAVSMPCFAEAAANESEIIARVLGSEESFTKKSVKGKYKTYDDLPVENQVLAVWSNDDGYVVKARVFYGAEYYQNPQMDVYVGVAKDGTIKGVDVGEYVDHTPEYVAQMTPEYLASAYAGQMASSSFLADAVTGATFSSDAVLYAVQLSANYTANVFKAGETNVTPIEIKRMMLAVPGAYEPLEVDDAFSVPNGEVQYAAKGTTEDGISFCALVVKSGFVPDNPENNMALPVYQIWIDTATDKVFAANLFMGGFYEGFEMPEDKLALYRDVVIADATVFDNFSDALIVDAPEYILTSASGSFADTTTGATPEGNDTSRSVRDCFITAAHYYAAHVK